MQHIHLNQIVTFIFKTRQDGSWVSHGTSRKMTWKNEAGTSRWSAVISACTVAASLDHRSQYMDGPPALLKGEKKEKEKGEVLHLFSCYTHMTHDLCLKDNYIYICTCGHPLQKCLKPHKSNWRSNDNPLEWGGPSVQTSSWICLDPPNISKTWLKYIVKFLWGKTQYFMGNINC